METTIMNRQCWSAGTASTAWLIDLLRQIMKAYIGVARTHDLASLGIITARVMLFFHLLASSPTLHLCKCRSSAGVLVRLRLMTFQICSSCSCFPYRSRASVAVDLGQAPK